MSRTPLLPAFALSATGLALAGTAQIQQIFAFGQFPTPFTKIQQFASAELKAKGIAEGSGYNFAFGLLTGNQAAPFQSGFISMSGSQQPFFAFAEAVHSVGLSVADIDFTVDDAVQVELTAFGTDGLPVGSVTRLLRPANSLAQENRTAVFLGLSSSEPILSIRIEGSLPQTMALDNLLFQ